MAGQLGSPGAEGEGKEESWAFWSLERRRGSVGGGSRQLLWWQALGPLTRPHVARNKKAHSRWSMGAVLDGDRSSFARSGPKERLAREMILKAEEGDYDWIYGILRDNLASPDVADVQGYTVLVAAAVSLPPCLLCPPRRVCCRSPCRSTDP